MEKLVFETQSPRPSLGLGANEPRLANGPLRDNELSNSPVMEAHRRAVTHTHKAHPAIGGAKNRC